MNLQEIEVEALHLSEDERAELAQKLLMSLDASSAEEIDEDWLVEAQARARALDEGLVEPVPAGGGRRKAASLGME